MKMTPFYSEAGQILGHVDLDMCLKSHAFVVVDDSPYRFSDGPVPMGEEVMSPIEVYHIRFRALSFQCLDDRKVVRHLVVDEEKLPKWFWDCKAIVTFVPHSWQEVR